MVESLAKSVGLQLASPPIRGPCGNALSEGTKMLVAAFYNSNDISWQAPGRKDRVIIREVDSDGNKCKKTEQTHYLLMLMKEAYNKFHEVHSDVKVGLSKFCELRPVHVKLFDHRPHHVCVCQYHENVRFLLLVLKDHSSLAVGFRDFINQVTCDSTNEECMSSSCDDCSNRIDNFAPSCPATTVTYQQWQTNDGKVEKVTINSTVLASFDELKKKLKDFLLHSYIKCKQSAHMDSLKAKCDT